MAPSLHSRALGAIWGTCVADALGGPIQFKAPGTFTRITGLEFVEPHKKPAGYVLQRKAKSPVLTFADRIRTMDP